MECDHMSATIDKAHARLGIALQGHCDEIGTTQYNLALGERRARAVGDYLIWLGIDPTQMKISSYGKARPITRGPIG